MKLIAFTFVILVTGCSATEKVSPQQATMTSKSITIYSNDKKGIESLISNKALASFKTDYSKALNHKAFAQSASGSWNWKSNRTSKEHAVTSALISCQRNNKLSEDIYPCEVINIDGEWLNK